MNFMFVVNDIDFGNVKFDAEQITEILLSRKLWLYTPITPNTHRFSEGDKVLVYIAGRNRRHFYASFQLDSPVQSTPIEPKTPISNIQKWAPPLQIAKIKDVIGFITDKRNWGLFFRQANKIVSDEDYALITGAKQTAK
jgi:hypothetical protein